MGTRDGSGKDVTFADARVLWANAAHELLVESAMRYHANIQYKEFADAVQQRTGIRTDVHMRHWIGGVLGLVADRCREQGEPMLTPCASARTA